MMPGLPNDFKDFTEEHCKIAWLYLVRFMLGLPLVEVERFVPAGGRHPLEDQGAREHWRVFFDGAGVGWCVRPMVLPVRPEIRQAVEVILSIKLSPLSVALFSCVCQSFERGEVPSAEHHPFLVEWFKSAEEVAGQQADLLAELVELALQIGNGDFVFEGPPERALKLDASQGLVGRFPAAMAPGPMVEVHQAEGPPLELYQGGGAVHAAF